MTPFFKAFLMLSATLYAAINVADAIMVSEPDYATAVLDNRDF